MRKILIILLIILYAAHPATAQSTAAKEVAVFTSEDLYVVHAKLVNKATGTGAVEMRAFVSAPGLHFEMRSEASDSLGNLRFLLKDIEGVKQLIFQTESPSDSLYRFEFGTPFITKYPDVHPLDVTPPDTDTLPFYGKADREYLLDDYTRFPTMEEVLREYAADLRLRKVNERFYISVLNTPMWSYFEKDPLVLLDGIPVYDMNMLLSLDPLKIKKMDIVSRKYFYGSLVCNGIVSFFSYTGDLAGYTLPAHAVVKEVNNQNSLK